MSYGKIVIAGITLTFGGWAVVVAIPFMFSALFYFIDRIVSLLLLFVGIAVICALVYGLMKN